MKKIITVLLIVLSLPLFSQYISNISIPNDDVIEYTKEDKDKIDILNTITADDLKKHLYTLASKEFGGRETGTVGNVKASKYISAHFESIGLKPGGENNTYFQSVIFTSSSWNNISVNIGESKYRHLWDFLAFPDRNGTLASTSFDRVLFLGYGINDPKHNDYKRAKVSGKVIMINKGEPMLDEKTYKLSGTNMSSDWSENLDLKLKFAKEKGVKLVLIIEDDIKGMLSENRRKLLSPTMELGNAITSESVYANHIYISTTMAKEIIGINSEKIIKARKKLITSKKPKSVKLKTSGQVSMVKKSILLGEGDAGPDGGRNVLGLLEGGVKKDEIVVVSAHYDHLGTKGESIYYGADDNASGTSTLLEISEALAMAKAKGLTLDRSVLFILMTAEEKGLLGSKYYVNQPLFPIENTIVDVNIDMVGRLDKKYESNPKSIYVIGSDRLSTDLHEINESINNKYSKLTLDYTYNSVKDPNRYYFRSDHYSFAKKGIPAIFFFNGVHEDYHKVTDTPDKINYEKMTFIGRHIGHLIYELASRKDRIVVDGVVE